MKKILVIEDNGKFIRFKNRKVRTPVTLEVTETELKQLKTSMNMADIQNWHVKDKAGKKEEIIDYDYAIADKTTVEELEDAPNTILGRFMKQGDSE